MTLNGREDVVAAELAGLSHMLTSGVSAAHTLQAVADTSLVLLDIDAAGILVADSSAHLQLVAATSHRVQELETESMQFSARPSLECFRDGRNVTPPDLAAMRVDWPVFAPRAERVGFAAAQAVPLRLAGRVVGVLSIYTAFEGSLLGSDLHLAHVLADLATLAFLTPRPTDAHELLAGRLLGAVRGRTLIEQARGMIAERSGASVDDALQQIRDAARRADVDLGSMATRIVDNGGRLIPPG